MKQTLIEPDEFRVIGQFGLADAAEKLDQLAEYETAADVRRAKDEEEKSRGILGSSNLVSYVLGRTKPWAHTSHTLGFIKSASPSGGPSSIVNAGSVEPETRLRGKPIRVSLNGLRVAQYPGRGVHHVLLNFYCQNSGKDDVEHLHFNAAYRVADGEHAAIVGQPIFDGVRPHAGGLSFRCVTINVKSEEDDRLISFLDGEAFKQGLKIAETVQPALIPFSAMAIGLARGIAGRSRNVAVQDVQLGLDFGSTAGGARLANGTYAAVQIPEKQNLVWDWSHWVFDHSSGRIVLKADRTTLVPYNYLLFAVDR